MKEGTITDTGSTLDLHAGDPLPPTECTQYKESDMIPSELPNELGCTLTRVTTRPPPSILPHRVAIHKDDDQHFSEYVHSCSIYRRPLPTRSFEQRLYKAIPPSWRSNLSSSLRLLRPLNASLTKFASLTSMSARL